MRTLLILAITAMVASCISCAPLTQETKESANHKVAKRQVGVGAFLGGMPTGFGSDVVIGPTEFPISGGMMGGYGMGGFGMGGLGIGGFGVGGLGVGGLGMGGFGMGGLGGLMSARSGNAPLEQFALMEGFGPQGHGSMGTGYGGIGKWSGPYGPSFIPEPFGYGRPFGGVYAGAYGSLDYGPFGMPLSGPINDPEFKAERISTLYNMNRELNNRQLLPGLIVRND